MAGVLIVDDDAAISDLLVAFLTGEGYQAYAAVGEVALALARERQPDIIFLDLMMPVLDGFAIMRLLWENPDTQALPIVVMSASYLLPNQPGDMNVRGYLAKPFDLMDVLAWVERAAPTAMTNGAPDDRSDARQPSLSTDEAGADGGF
jgi:CheY-like chemotaxis protein